MTDPTKSDPSGTDPAPTDPALVHPVPSDPVPTDPALVHHLALVEDWAEAVDAGTYRRSTRGRSLDEVGFVHCSTAEQVAGTANAFYADCRELVVLTIDTDRTGAERRDEDLEGHGVFPHLYGPVPVTAVVAVTSYRPGPDGRFGPFVPPT